MTRKLRCYIYTRVSTEIQVDGYSLEAQKDILRKEAAHRGMVVMDEYSDEGRSGKNISGRPEFQRMLDDIQSEKDEVDYVLVFKLSRFGRNTADIMSSLQLMEDYNVNLLCVIDGIDSGSGAGKLMVSVLSAVAELERENIRDQTMAGREQKARNGQWNGGFAPYGYKLEYKNGAKIGSLVIDEEEASLIREIYKRYQEMGLSSVAKTMTSDGYRKILRQNGSVEGISTKFVTLVIDNPVYMGKIAYGRRRSEKIKGTRNEYHIVPQAKDSYKLYEGVHEAIIDEETWYKCQAKRERNAFTREKTYNLEHAHILSSLVKCPVCGASMYGNINRKKKPDGSFYKDIWYYVCKHRKIATGRICAFTKQVRQDVLNEEVFAVIRLMWADEDFRKNILQRFGEINDISGLKNDLERLETEKEKLVSKKNKIGEKLKLLDTEDGYYDMKFDAVMTQIASIGEEIAELDAQIMNKRIAIENAEGESLSYEMFKHTMEFTLQNLDTIDDAAMRKLMHQLIERIDIFSEKQEDGRWVKSIQLKLPIRYGEDDYRAIFFDVDAMNDFEGNAILMDKDDIADVVVPTDGGNFTPQEKHVETVVLMSKEYVMHVTMV